MTPLYHWQFVVTDGLGRYIWGVTAATIEEAKEVAYDDCGSHVNLNQIGCKRVYGQYQTQE
jgi:hypothetical protein